MATRTPRPPVTEPAVLPAVLRLGDPSARDASGRSLVGEDLSGLDLAGWDFSGADLSDCDLTGSSLPGAKLVGATLRRAKLDRCEWLGADLTGADLTQCVAHRAGFGGAILNEACLFQADLEGATFSHAILTGSDLRAANLTRARLVEANLVDADFGNANLSRAHLGQSRVGQASFLNTDLRGADLRDLQEFERAAWIGADIRDVNFCGAYLVRRHIMDANYLHEFKSRSAWTAAVHWVWWATSDCGRSFARWGALTGVATVAFALAYLAVGLNTGQHAPGLLSALYFSVATVTTLGFGDIQPSNALGQALVMLEVIFGYLALGGLISIFGNKMSRRAG